jgi:hypothetical protein
VSAAKGFAPEAFAWLNPRLRPYAPTGADGPCNVPQVLPDVSAPTESGCCRGNAPLCCTPASHAPAPPPRGIRQWIRHLLH